MNLDNNAKNQIQKDDSSNNEINKMIDEYNAKVDAEKIEKLDEEYKHLLQLKKEAEMNENINNNISQPYYNQNMNEENYNSYSERLEREKLEKELKRLQRMNYELSQNLQKSKEANS